MKLDDAKETNVIENLWIWVAFRLPRRLAYWSMVRVAAEASASDNLVNVVVPELTVLEAMGEWQ